MIAAGASSASTLSALRNNNDDNSHHLLSALSVPGTVLSALQATILGAANDRKPQCLSSSGLRMLISLPAWPLPRGPKWLLISTLRKLKEEETKKRAASLSAHTPHSPTLEPAYSVAVVCLASPNAGKSGLGAAWEPAVKSTGKEQEKTTRRQELRIAGLVRGLLTLCLVQ
ncbi:uncharacterized protein LOC110350617 isoform X4 [Heterocephalus glaber]|uniref:Uncharacterized protein LOC110350617 isoform X4 n=1 Tax=Heterocephalus glaber TaxID=10181 RepID=A0AAX6TE08_HETGA|nr:uncharacterized protein LOC110350617 isoform X4 [Heterocephalus glaber]